MWIQIQQQPGVSRVVQTVVTSLSSFSTVSQVGAVTTTANTQSNAMRILQTVPAAGTKITGMSLHPLPIVPVRAAPTPTVKVTTAQPQNIGQTVQIKPAQPASLRVSSTNSGTATSSTQPVQGQYITSPHNTTTYYSFETTGKITIK